MSNPFNSDYAKTTVTAAASIKNLPKREAPQTASSSQPAVNSSGQTTYGFEPNRYGLGKPKRIIIRGKISIE